MGSTALNSSAFSQRLEGNDGVLLDVRLRADYDRRHLPQARSICVFEMTFLESALEVAPDFSKPIAIYGASDSCETTVASEKLARAGYQEILLLEGGIDAWEAAGLPVDHGPAPEPIEASADGSHWGGWRALEVDECWIEWAGRNLGTKHWGTLGVASGSIQFLDGKPHRGQIAVDMTSITNVNLGGTPLQSVLEEHLRSDDFFDTDQYPSATFEIEAIDPIQDTGPGRPNLEIGGSLTLRGQRETLSFSATSGFDDAGRWIAQAHFDIDRTRWGVIYGSSRFFRNLGMHLVDDTISLQMKIVASGAPRTQ